MAPSRATRHGIALVLAIVWTVVAVMQFADFSGEPTPRWRELTSTLLPPLCLGLIFLNMRLDQREPSDAERDQVARRGGADE